LRFHLIPSQWLSSRTQTITNIDEDLRKKEPLCTVGWWECKLVQPLWKAVRKFLKKLKVDLP
jgi:hypothetical protein